MRVAAPLLLLALTACPSSKSSAPPDGASPPEEARGGDAASTAATASSLAEKEESSRDTGRAKDDDGAAPTTPLAQAPEAKPSPPLEDPKSKEPSKGSRDENRPASPMAATAKSLSGRLSSTDVEGVVTGAIDRFTKCTTVDLVVEIKAVIGGDGKVLEVKVPRSQPDDPRARDCVSASFKELTFPRATDNRSSPIAFELNLRRRPS